MSKIVESEVRSPVGSFFSYERDGVLLQVSFGAAPHPSIARAGFERRSRPTPLALRLEAGFSLGEFAVPFSLELVSGGFDRRVLEVLCSVRSGETTTYAELARRVGAPKAARAVGGAMRRNPLPLVVPCHRVLPATGRVGSYSAGGPAVKEWLLEVERGAAAVPAAAE